MSFERSILQALQLMPKHRERASKRAATLGLDDLIDEARERGELGAGALDLLLMGTRFRARALKALSVFLKGKPTKPRELEDLFVLCFASLLSRDRMPAPVQLNTFVETTARTFGPHMKGLMNAWGRHVLRQQAEFESERETSPTSWLPEVWLARWHKSPKLLDEAARRSFARPEAGISAFDTSLKLERKPLADWQAAPPFQAMDPGSWKLLEWIDARLADTRTENFLDICAAPGGKFIALSMLRKKHGLKKSVATDAKFPRLERLKSNVQTWANSLPEGIETRVLVWGEDETPAEWKSETWDIVLADLPCSGSGTLHTRPDLLDKDPFERLESLMKIQKQILTSLRTLRIKDLFVSICSVDPEEIRFVSQCLGSEPQFSSWGDGSPAHPMEGLTAWHLKNPTPC